MNSFLVACTELARLARALAVLASLALCFVVFCVFSLRVRIGFPDAEIKSVGINIIDGVGKRAR